MPPFIVSKSCQSRPGLHISYRQVRARCLGRPSRLSRLSRPWPRPACLSSNRSGRERPQLPTFILWHRRREISCNHCYSRPLHGRTQKWGGRALRRYLHQEMRASKESVHETKNAYNIRGWHFNGSSAKKNLTNPCPVPIFTHNQGRSL